MTQNYQIYPYPAKSRDSDGIEEMLIKVESCYRLAWAKLNEPRRMAFLEHK